METKNLGKVGHVFLGSDSDVWECPIRMAAKRHKE
jgi:hypothetical protein